MDFKLVLVTSGEAFFKAWPIISKGVDRVLSFSNDTDVTTVMNEILAGSMLLWLVFVDGVYTGFVTTNFRDIGTNPPKKILWINHVFKKPGVTADIHPLVIGELEKFAKRKECTELRFMSVRPIQKVADSLGFKPSYTEYRKEL